MLQHYSSNNWSILTSSRPLAKHRVYIMTLPEGFSLRLSNNLPLGTKPVLFLLAGFMITGFIQRISPRSNLVL